MTSEQAREVMEAFKNEKIKLQDLKVKDPESHQLVLNAKKAQFNEAVAEKNKDQIKRTVQIRDIEWDINNHFQMLQKGKSNSQGMF